MAGGRWAIVSPGAIRVISFAQNRRSHGRLQRQPSVYCDDPSMRSDRRSLSVHGCPSLRTGASPSFVKNVHCKKTPESDAMSLITLVRPFVLATALSVVHVQNLEAENEADVLVYGSTPGGFCAAIAAAREGASVILLEPTDHVGAMSTGGLSHCDSNQMVRSTLMGLFDEWHTRVVKDYTDRGLEAPYNPAKKDQSRWTFEPHVAMRVTMQMLDEAGVTVLTERYLDLSRKTDHDHVAGHKERHVHRQSFCRRHLRG